MLAKVDTLLLRAALLEGTAAREAYGELRRDFDLDALDYGRQRLLPLLHENLIRLGLDHEHLGRIRGVRHYHWALNHVRARKIGPVLADMRQAGVPTMILKGAALVASYLPDASLRPMDDVDILVPWEHRETAYDILIAHNFTPRHASRRFDFAGIARITHGWPFNGTGRVDIDLHWHLLYLDCRPEADEDFWRRAQPATFAGQPTSTLDPTDQLLHLIVHGGVWNEVSALRWAADAVCVARAAGKAIVWDRLVDDACRRRLAPPLHLGLSLLRRHLEFDVPDHVLRALRRASGPTARFEFELRSRSPVESTPFRRRLVGLMDHRRRDSRRLRRPLLFSVSSYLCQTAGARNVGGLAALAGFAALGRPDWLRRCGLDEWARPPVPAGLPPLGTVLDSATGGAVRRAYIDGWSYHETEGCWTTARVARLGWALDPAGTGDLVLEIDGAAFCPVSEGSPPIFPEVTFFANRVRIGRWHPDGKGGFVQPGQFVVPEEARLRRDALVVSIVVNRPRAPADYGVSADVRPLGVLVRRALLRPSEASERPESGAAAA